MASPLLDGPVEAEDLAVGGADHLHRPRRPSPTLRQLMGDGYTTAITLPVQPDPAPPGRDHLVREASPVRLPSEQRPPDLALPPCAAIAAISLRLGPFRHRGSTTPFETGAGVDQDP